MISPAALKGEQEWERPNFTEGFLTRMAPAPARAGTLGKLSLVRVHLVIPFQIHLALTPAVSYRQQVMLGPKTQKRGRWEGPKRCYVLVMSQRSVWKRGHAQGRGLWDVCVHCFLLVTQRADRASHYTSEHRLVSIFSEQNTSLCITVCSIAVRCCASLAPKCSDICRK